MIFSLPLIKTSQTHLLKYIKNPSRVSTRTICYQNSLNSFNIKTIWFVQKRFMQKGGYKVIKEVSKHASVAATPSSNASHNMNEKPEPVSPLPIAKSEHELPIRAKSPDKVEISEILKAQKEAQRAFNSPTLSDIYQKTITSSPSTNIPRTSTTLTSPNDQKVGSEIITRNYPGQGYTAYNQKKNNLNQSEVRTATNKNVPQHESSHTLLEDNETKKQVAVLSSCKNEQKGFKKVSETNYKGQLVDGSPNSKPKEQWMKPFASPRIHEEGSLIENKDATTFIKNYEITIDKIIIESKVNEKNASGRVHKDSSQLYHENGLPIYDSTGNEIDY